MKSHRYSVSSNMGDSLHFERSILKRHLLLHLVIRLVSRFLATGFRRSFRAEEIGAVVGGRSNIGLIASQKANASTNGNVFWTELPCLTFFHKVCFLPFFNSYESGSSKDSYSKLTDWNESAMDLRMKKKRGVGKDDPQAKLQPFGNAKEPCASFCKLSANFLYNFCFNVHFINKWSINVIQRW